MNNEPNSFWERWPDGWRLVGLVLSSVILAIVLVLYKPTPPSQPVATPAATAVETIGPISPLLPPAPGVSPAITAPLDQVQVGAPMVIEGIAPPQSTVRVYDGAAVLGEAQADETGRWRLEVGRTWSEAPHELRAASLDASGKEIASSPPLVVMPVSPQAVPPTMPTPTRSVLAFVPVQPAARLGQPGLRMRVSVDQLRPGQLISVDDLPVISGMAPAGAIVRLYDLLRLVGQTIAGPDGTWQIATEGQFPPGDHLIWGEALTEEGILLGTLPPTFVTVAPQATLSIEMPANDLLQEPYPAFSGTGEPGKRVRVYVDTRVVAEAVVDTSGRWEVRLTEPLPPGQHMVRAALVDEGGRLLAESQPLSITVPQPTRSLPVTGGERPDAMPQP
ncbi:MAG: Ig-like domain-containing protein [Anaerolineae bacterium]|nr:Ig-like domain-containing protein [Anaerolineae bacterium]MDW8098165.1 Ig-like domain-containing protein [Anaerolineae bacterium]